MGFPGRDWTGQPMRGYLNLEDGTPNEIFVYLDPKWREFQGWGTYGGWLLGEHAGPATGVEDFEFVRALISHLEDNYCINTEQIFATGQSWGGDMSHVLACFVGDKVRAAVPVAANTPYWLPKTQVAESNASEKPPSGPCLDRPTMPFQTSPIKVPMVMNATPSGQKKTTAAQSVLTLGWGRLGNVWNTRIVMCRPDTACTMHSTAIKSHQDTTRLRPWHFSGHLTSRLTDAAT